MEIKRLSDQMISESFAKHAQDVYVLPASEVFYIYFRYGKKNVLEGSIFGRWPAIDFKI